MQAVSYDGSLKAWDAHTLDIVADRSGVHSGERVHCLAVGPDGLLYTGGDDKVGGWDGCDRCAAAGGEWRGCGQLGLARSSRHVCRRC